jgi:hypothetical protein
VTRVRVGFDVDGLTTYSLGDVLWALQSAYDVALTVEAESRGLVDQPFTVDAAKALEASPELLIERIQMTSPLYMWVAVPGSGWAFIGLLRMIRD